MRIRIAVWNGLVAAIVAATFSPLAAEEGAWSATLSAVTSRVGSGDGAWSDVGIGGSVDYRVSRRFGVGLAVYTNEHQDGFEIGLFDVPIRLRTSLRLTPAVARLLWHLTPDSRADLYLGPVAGYVTASDLEIRYVFDFPGEPPISETARIPMESGWAWGAAAGVDFALGRGRSFVRLEATYLDFQGELALGGESEDLGGLDPLTIQAGYGFRF